MAKQLDKEVIEKAKDLMELCEAKGYAAIFGLYDKKTNAVLNGCSGVAGEDVLVCARALALIAKETKAPVEAVKEYFNDVFAAQCVKNGVKVIGGTKTEKIAKK